LASNGAAISALKPRKDSLEAPKASRCGQQQRDCFGRNTGHWVSTKDQPDSVWGAISG
jgi:hypothetical protein